MKFWDVEQNAMHNLDAARLTLGSNKKLHWVCNECPQGMKHRWRASPASRKLGTKKPHGGPICAGKKACKCNSLQKLYPDLTAKWVARTAPHLTTTLHIPAKTFGGSMISEAVGSNPLLVVLMLCGGTSDELLLQHAIA